MRILECFLSSHNYKHGFSKNVTAFSEKFSAVTPAFRQQVLAKKIRDALAVSSPRGIFLFVPLTFVWQCAKMIKKEVIALVRAAICDDENAMLDRLYEHILTEYKRLNTEISIEKFLSGGELLNAHKDDAFDVVFLDIDMPQINGFDIAESINNGEKTLIVFVTTHDELVYSSLRFRPFRFIRKAHLESELPETLAAVNTEITKRNAGRKFPFRTKNGEVFLDIGNIEYIEIYGHTLRVSVADGETIECYGSLSALEGQLAAFDFVRVHKSYLVNLKYIYSIEKTQVILDDKTAIPLSRYKAADVKTKFKNYLRSAL